LRVLAFTQGDPAGIGPEVLLRVLARPEPEQFRIAIIERSAVETLLPSLPATVGEAASHLEWVDERELAPRARPGGVVAVDPVRVARQLSLGRSQAADARGALAALDLGIELTLRGVAQAIVTGPVSKVSIATHCMPDFRGHTDYIAARCGLSNYGRDYLMTFLAPDLRVALLSTHLPLRAALDAVTPEAILDALVCLARHLPGRIAVAGFNPHAGENGLLGAEDSAIVAPAVAKARAMGIDAHGPESADSLFARARRGEFASVLALYHDQGLIAVKTASFGGVTNWTLGLPVLRTSVDHGTAFAIAGRGIADEKPLLSVVETTLRLLDRGHPLPRDARDRR
jgi:4-hydroxythreonine-4-phosphate dehydrogenase